MNHPDRQFGAGGKALLLEAEIRRNRRRTLRILSGVMAIAVLWPVCSAYRRRQSAALPERTAIANLRSSLHHPAAPRAKRRAVYPYSVIPGGAYSGAALERALAKDAVAAAHYAGFDAANARTIGAGRGMRMHASYRIGDRIYWTGKPIALREGETLLTNGIHLARAGCGNRLSEAARHPIGPLVDLDPVEPEEGEAQWTESGSEDGGGTSPADRPISSRDAGTAPHGPSEGNGQPAPAAQGGGSEPVSKNGGGPITAGLGAGWVGPGGWIPDVLGAAAGLDAPGRTIEFPSAGSPLIPPRSSDAWQPPLGVGPPVPAAPAGLGPAGERPEIPSLPAPSRRLFPTTRPSRDNGRIPVDQVSPVNVIPGSASDVEQGDGGGSPGGPPIPDIDPAEFAEAPPAIVPEPGGLAWAAAVLSLLAISMRARRVAGERSRASSRSPRAGGSAASGPE